MTFLTEWALLSFRSTSPWHAGRTAAESNLQKFVNAITWDHSTNPWERPQEPPGALLS
jgi:hypothetical protein